MSEIYCCDICGVELTGSSHYHCGNCGSESGMLGHLGAEDPKTGERKFNCKRPEWWQRWLDEEKNEEDNS